jgi:hypothetical protein
MRNLNYALLTVTAAVACWVQTWPAVALVVVTAAVFILCDKGEEKAEALSLQLDHAIESLSEITKLKASLESLEKKHAEVSKVVSTSTISQAFRPRIKD